MNALVWSLGTLLLAFLISAQKARRLPRKIWPRSQNGNEIGIALKANGAEAANGLTPDTSS